VAHQACGFVQDEKIGIFVEYGKRGAMQRSFQYRLTPLLRRWLWARLSILKPGGFCVFPVGEADALARLDAGFRPCPFAVYLYPALAEQALYGREGNLRQGLAENPIQTAA
jgi:hypothetical protein